MAKKSSELSQREKRRQVKNGDITLTDEMKQQIISAKRRHVNLSDKNSPEITDWKDAERAKFYRPIKLQITIRIDADVLDWFKHSSHKYQSLINKVCREYMNQHLQE